MKTRRGCTKNNLEKTVFKKNVTDQLVTLCGAKKHFFYEEMTGIAETSCYSTG